MPTPQALKAARFRDAMTNPPPELIEAIRAAIVRLNKAMPPATSPEVLHARINC